MQPKPDVDAYRRPSKMRIGLAVAWLIVSLGVGGAVGRSPPPTASRRWPRSASPVADAGPGRSSR